MARSPSLLPSWQEFHPGKKEKKKKKSKETLRERAETARQGPALALVWKPWHVPEPRLAGWGPSCLQGQPPVSGTCRRPSGSNLKCSQRPPTPLPHFPQRTKREMICSRSHGWGEGRTDPELEFRVCPCHLVSWRREVRTCPESGQLVKGPPYARMGAVCKKEGPSH